VSNANTWTLRDAKMRFSEVVRRARAGAPQEITVHGSKAVIVVDAQRFEVKPKALVKAPAMTMAEFIEGSKKYRGAAEGIDFEQPFPMVLNPRRSPFEGMDEP
jgi:antitoxin Phd